MTLPPVIPDLDTAWITQAACADQPDLPWIGTNLHPDQAEVVAMRRICAACPVRTACKEFADAAGVCAGWWAGRNYNRHGPYAPLPPQPAAHRGDQVPGYGQETLPLDGAA